MWLVLVMIVLNIALLVICDNLTIPEGIRFIDKDMFSHCTIINLTLLSDSIVIEDDAFTNSDITNILHNRR